LALVVLISIAEMGRKKKSMYVDAVEAVEKPVKNP